MKIPKTSIVESIIRYFKLRIDAIRLRTIGKVATFAGHTALCFIIVCLLFFCLFYLSFGFAGWLGTVLHSFFLGMLCTGGIFLVFILLVLLFRKPIVRGIGGKVAAYFANTDIMGKDDEE